MGRRRRIEFYFAVAFTAAAVSYQNHTAADPLARPPHGSIQKHVDGIVFFLDPVFDHYGPTAGGRFRRVVNVLTAACWGVGIGFIVSLVLIDNANRWRMLKRTHGEEPPDTENS